MSGPNRWIIDSGATYDLVAQKDLTTYYQSLIYNTDEKIEMDTANGVIESAKMVDIPSKTLGEDINPYILPETPAVISLGRKCCVHGWSFYWPPYGSPILTSPGGAKTALDVVNCVPYLNAEAKALVSRTARESEDSDANATRGSVYPLRWQHV